MRTGPSGLALIAEIGSTTTLINAFADLDGEQPVLAGQGQALTTVDQGDVRIGLSEARTALEKQIGPCGDAEMLATSSAAGGLSVTVHGLVYEMTVRAAREAALGAGAVVRLVTAGLLEEEDLGQVEAIAPRLILLAGGIDYGEERTVLENARRLARLDCRAPVVYAGNVALQRRVTAIFASAGREVHLLPNVYPSIDQLVVDPARAVLHRIFEEQIIKAPGMDQVREMVKGRIMPTPGAVMLAAKALYEEIGDLVVVDVGGATTDVHSVTEGSISLRDRSVEPEPLAKRTVEGDLGVYRNAPQIAAMLDLDILPPAMPEAGKEAKLALKFTETAVKEAIQRHVGRLKHIFTPTGRVEVIVGRDLTAVKWVIGTGGALTRLPDGMKILAGARRRRGEQLLLPEHPKVILDRDYVMAACGVLLEHWPKAAMTLLRKSLGDEMPNPRLIVKLEAIAANAAEVVRRAHAHGVAVAGVTKVCCGAPPVAEAMLSGGVDMLADSRLENLAGLRRAGLGRVPLMLLRLPMVSRVTEAASLADVILVSELATMRSLGQAARGHPVQVVLMIDLGDLREGLWPDRAAEAAAAGAKIDGLDLAGFGTNLTCYGGVKPTATNLEQLVALVMEARRATGLALAIVSGGNTSSLPLLWQGTLPPGITHLRVGEGIMLGVETLARQPLPGLRQDAFRLSAEVIEVQRKPSVPRGEICQDAFGHTPQFVDRGWERRAVLALGRQDCTPEGMLPLREGLMVLGGGSDHLLLADRAGLNVGEEVEFSLSYGALLAAMTSPYVYKEYLS